MDSSMGINRKLQGCWTMLALLLCTGCGSRTLVDTPTDGTGAVIQSLGDVGFRLTRTHDNQEAAPYVLKVNGVVVGNDVTGLATRVVVKPGKVRLTLRCIFSGRVLDPKGAGAPAPFTANANGEGKISGVTGNQAFSLIELSDELSAGSTYGLQCAQAGPNRARAWLTQQTEK